MVRNDKAGFEPQFIGSWKLITQGADPLAWGLDLLYVICSRLAYVF